MSAYPFDPNLTVAPDHYSGGVPVFKPTMAQFENFYQFNKAINKYGMQSGIVKIIPPKEWLDGLEGSYTQESLESVKIKNPIVQQINAVAPGVFTSQNVEKQRTFNMFQWKEISERSNYMPPAPRTKQRDDTSAAKTAPETQPTSKAAISSPARGRARSSVSVAKDPPSVEEVHHVDTSEFTTERCEELEKNYWRSLTYAEPMYGADSMGSLFPDSVKSWNVAHLPNILDLMDAKLPGVNEAYLYAGLWKASFAWHLEDQDLYSINYLHFGAPKQWYSIPQEEAPKFFDLMKDTYAEEYSSCPEFLRHKTFIVSPQFLEKHDVRYNKIVHNQQEFIITYPYGYHAGFNYGYNLAESVNFALDDWFPIGKITKKCECIHDSVGINVKQLICNFHGIPYEDTTDDTETETKTPTASPPPVEPKEKKRSLQVKPVVPRKKPKLVSSPIRECYLCSNVFAHLPVAAHPYFELLHSDYIEKSGLPWKVHRICASMFPEQLHAIKNAHGNVVVTGLRSITKNQRKLRCTVCSKGSSAKTKNVLQDSGACYQCTYPKCTRAYHGTCGLSGGVSLNFEQKSYLCKYHRPKEKSKEPLDLNEFSSIAANSWIQFTFNGNPYSGMVLSNNVSENSFNVFVYPTFSDLLEVPYESVLKGTVPLHTLKVEESHLPMVSKRNSDSEIVYHHPEHDPRHHGNYTSLSSQEVIRTRRLSTATGIKEEDSPTFEHSSTPPQTHTIIAHSRPTLPDNLSNHNPVENQTVINSRETILQGNVAP